MDSGEIGGSNILPPNVLRNISIPYKIYTDKLVSQPPLKPLKLKKPLKITAMAHRFLFTISQY